MWQKTQTTENHEKKKKEKKNTNLVSNIQQGCKHEQLLKQTF